MDMPWLIDIVNKQGGRFALVGANSSKSPELHVELDPIEFEFHQDSDVTARRYCYPIANFGEEFKEFSVIQKLQSSPFLNKILVPQNFIPNELLLHRSEF